MISYWGIDHGEEISKKDKKKTKYAAGAAGGAVAGRWAAQTAAAGGLQKKRAIHGEALTRGLNATMDAATRPGAQIGEGTEAGVRAVKAVPGYMKVANAGRAGWYGGAAAGVAGVAGARAYNKKKKAR